MLTSRLLRGKHTCHYNFSFQLFPHAHDSTKETWRLFLVSEMAHKLSKTKAPCPLSICNQTPGFSYMNWWETIGSRGKHQGRDCLTKTLKSLGENLFLIDVSNNAIIILFYNFCLFLLHRTEFHADSAMQVYEEEPFPHTSPYSPFGSFPSYGKPLSPF